VPTEESKKKHSQTLHNKFVNDADFRNKQLISAENARKVLANNRKNPEWHVNLSNKIRNSYTSERKEMYRAIRSTSNSNRVWTEEARKKMGIKKRKQWDGLSDEDKLSWNINRSKGWKNCPNKQEQKLIQMLDTLQLHFIYSGDGKYWIRGMNPDFLNSRDKKVIEFNGCWFHGCKECYHNVTKVDDSAERIARFKERGYDCLIVWEHELKDMEQVKNKLMQFGGCDGKSN
jgi:G:T-mismatch repair DNA endonuclease (very short patch repair protein)